MSLANISEKKPALGILILYKKPVKNAKLRKGKIMPFEKPEKGELCNEKP